MGVNTKLGFIKTGQLATLILSFALLAHWGLNAWKIVTFYVLIVVVFVLFAREEELIPEKTIREKTAQLLPSINRRRKDMGLDELTLDEAVTIWIDVDRELKKALEASEEIWQQLTRWKRG
jgi:hypothetical protein